MDLDAKDCKILDLLQENCRMPLTALAKEVGLSIDSVKKRMQKMIDKRIFYPKIQLRPRNFGFANVVDVRVKLQYGSEKDVEEFIAYLKSHPQVVELFSVAGEWDIAMVLIARDAIELGNLTATIRNKFGKLINSWTVSLTIKSYKFENYSMSALGSISAKKGRESYER